MKPIESLPPLGQHIRQYRKANRWTLSAFAAEHGMSKAYLWELENGATHIAINIPKEGADKSLPALAAMLEHNAVFVRKSWRELETVKPVMGITLGNTFTSGDSDVADLVIQAQPEAIDESFVIATPEVFVSNKRAIEKKDAEITRLRTELEHTKQVLSRANERIETLENEAAGVEV